MKVVKIILGGFLVLGSLNGVLKAVVIMRVISAAGQPNAFSYTLGQLAGSLMLGVFGIYLLRSAFKKPVAVATTESAQ